MLLLIVGAVASVVIGRCYNVPRDVRRNDTRSRNADEDLATWIDDEDKGQRLAHIRSIQERQEAHRKGTPDYSLTQPQDLRAYAEDFRRQRAEENGEPPPPPLDL